jgi:hypothetical protein
MGGCKDMWGDVPKGWEIVGVLMDNLNSTNQLRVALRSCCCLSFIAKYARYRG